MKQYKIFIGVVIISLVFAMGAPLNVFANNSPENTPSANNYPIILVHGLAGWGDDEMLGINYWGGKNRISSLLNRNGHETYTATVGPISSNWDRAVELYYYIKGGTVDYGAAHAAEYGHERFGRTFPGLYPEWDGERKIHLVGHSMGGQTIRVLNELLVNGSIKEQQYQSETSNEELSPLFSGGHKWIHSISSIATPHNGSTFADHKQLVPFIKDLVVSLAALSGTNSFDNIVYDFKVDQWGLKRKFGERLSVYRDRVLNSEVLKSKDISVYDLTTKGAEELNEWVQTQPDTYHFSYTGNATYRLLSGRYYPMLTMNPLMAGASKHMGSYTRSHTSPIITNEWWPNDGLVNVVSSKYPFNQPNKPFDSNIAKGEWNYHRTNQTWDHLDFIGLSLSHAVGIRETNSFYLNMADKLKRLPE